MFVSKRGRADFQEMMAGGKRGCYMYVGAFIMKITSTHPPSLPPSPPPPPTHTHTHTHTHTGVLISSGSQPILRHNRIFGGHAAGIEVTNGGGGIIERNEVFDNHFDGVCLATGVVPTLSGRKGMGIRELGVELQLCCLLPIQDNPLSPPFFSLASRFLFPSSSLPFFLPSLSSCLLTPSFPPSPLLSLLPPFHFSSFHREQSVR